MTTQTHTIKAEEVTPQSLRALEGFIDGRGPEELRYALLFLQAALRTGHDVTIKAKD
jgi:hypothetical protein